MQNDNELNGKTEEHTSNSLSLWTRGVKRKLSSSTENGGCQSCKTVETLNMEDSSEVDPIQQWL